jgi:hypothetical protein
MPLQWSHFKLASNIADCYDLLTVIVHQETQNGKIRENHSVGTIISIVNDKRNGSVAKSSITAKLYTAKTIHATLSTSTRQTLAVKAEATMTSWRTETRGMYTRCMALIWLASGDGLVHDWTGKISTMRQRYMSRLFISWSGVSWDVNTGWLAASRQPVNVLGSELPVPLLS